MYRLALTSGLILVAFQGVVYAQSSQSGTHILDSTRCSYPGACPGSGMSDLPSIPPLLPGGYPSADSTYWVDTSPQSSPTTYTEPDSIVWPTGSDDSGSLTGTSDDRSGLTDIYNHDPYNGREFFDYSIFD